ASLSRRTHGGWSRRQYRDPIGSELLVSSHQCQAVGLSLCHQHAVERVAMQLRQSASARRMVEGDAKALKAAAFHRSLEIVRQLQAAEPGFDREFPCRGNAGKDVVLGILDLDADAVAKPRRLSQRPQ